MSSTYSHVCSSVRMSYPCPNKRRCRDIYNRTDLEKFIRELRTEVWGSPTDEPDLKKRKANVLKLLRRMKKTGTDGTIDLVYRINDLQVCKCFFKVHCCFCFHNYYDVSLYQSATGISSKMFNAAVAAVENRSDSNLVSRQFQSGPATGDSAPCTFKKTASEANIIGFLDAFFKGRI